MDVRVDTRFFDEFSRTKPLVSEKGHPQSRCDRHEALQVCLENIELLNGTNEGDSRNPKKPLLCRQEKGYDHQDEGGE